MPRICELKISLAARHAARATCERRFFICRPRSLPIVPVAHASRHSGCCFAIWDRLFRPFIVISLKYTRLYRMRGYLSIRTFPSSKCKCTSHLTSKWRARVATWISRRHLDFFYKTNAYQSLLSSCVKHCCTIRLDFSREGFSIGEAFLLEGGRYLPMPRIGTFEAILLRDSIASTDSGCVWKIQQTLYILYGFFANLL